MADEIKKVVSVDLGNTATSLREYRKHIDELRGSLLQLDETSEDYNKIAQEITTEQNKLNEVMKVGKGVTDAAEGSYNQLSQTMSELKKQWKATADEAERNELGKQILDINNQLKELDASTGNYQRNVGDYANAFEKAFDNVLGGITSIDGPIGQLGGTIKKMIPIVKQVNATAITGLSGVKKAIASTGIGLLVVLVGELVAHWEDVVKWAQKLLGVVDEDALAIERAADQAERLKEEFSYANREIEQQSKLMAAQGKSTLEQLEAELVVRKEQKDKARELYLNDKTNNEELKKAANEAELAWRKTLNSIEVEKTKIATQEKQTLANYIAAVKTEIEKENEAYQQALALAEKYGGDKEAIIAKHNENIAAINAKNNSTILDQDKNLVKEMVDIIDLSKLTPIPTPEEVKKSFELHKQEVLTQLNSLSKIYEEQQFDFSIYGDEMTIQEQLDTKFQIESTYIQQRIALNQELLNDENITAEERKRIEEEQDALRLEMLHKEKQYNAESVKNKKISEEEKKQLVIATALASLSAMGSMFNSLADMEEEGSEKQKSLQIAGATVNTLAGAVGAFLQGMASYPPPYGAIIGGVAAAAATAAGIAQIAKIKATNKNSSNASSAAVATPSLPEPSMTEVSPLLDEQADLNRMEMSGVDGDSTKEQKNIRVYVVDQDIRDANNKAEVVENNATF